MEITIEIGVFKPYGLEIRTDGLYIGLDNNKLSYKKPPQLKGCLPWIQENNEGDYICHIDTNQHFYNYPNGYILDIDIDPTGNYIILN